MKKRVVKKEKLIICILSVLIVLLTICLVIAIVSKNHKGNKNQYKEIKEIICGQNQDDLSLALCYRYFERGYVVTLKNYSEETDLNPIVDSLVRNNNGIPAILVRNMELKELLRNYNKNDKDYNLEPVIYIPDYNVDYDKLVSNVSKDTNLDKVLKYSGLINR